MSRRRPPTPTFVDPDGSASTHSTPVHDGTHRMTTAGEMDLGPHARHIH